MLTKPRSIRTAIRTNMTLITLTYIAAGMILPLYYVPQILRLAKDDSGLESYSMSKSATQTTLRVAMMPFVFGVGNMTMTFIVCLDLLGRLIELGTAVSALRRQGFAWRRIFMMCRPVAMPSFSFMPQAVLRRNRVLD